MSADEAKDMKARLASIGWRLNAETELFEDKKGEPVPWEDILVAMPHLSLNDLDSFSDHMTGR